MTIANPSTETDTTTNPGVEDRKLLIYNSIVNGVVKVLRALIGGVVLILITKYISEALIALAGKSTFADISVSGSVVVNPEEKSTDTLCTYIGVAGLLTGIVGASLARVQAKLRRQTVAHLSPYKELYEKLLDKNRTTSGLLSNGNARPEDE